MRPFLGIALLLALGALGVHVLRDAEASSGADPQSGVRTARDAANSAGSDARADRAGDGARDPAAGATARPRGRGTHAEATRGAAGTATGADGIATPGGRARATGARPRRGWPVRAGAGGTGSATKDPAEPKVAIDLAFQALNLVGVDPAAEQTWMTAINDPAMPEGVRSDLIEDLNDEGYRDNDRPGIADLPLILARLDLIERLAPYAMDAVNAAAFEEAYKDLLNMVVRLGGAPATGG